MEEDASCFLLNSVTVQVCPCSLLREETRMENGNKASCCDALDNVLLENLRSFKSCGCQSDITTYLNIVANQVPPLEDFLILVLFSTL